MLQKVLCIDDDPITLMLCRKVIERVCFSVHVDTAQNGEEAIQYFESNSNQEENEKPELVFLDLNMPIMNGWELLDQFIKKEFTLTFPKTRFIVLSSTIDPCDIEKSKSYSIVLDFISKPITKEILENLKEKLT